MDLHIANIWWKCWPVSRHKRVSSLGQGEWGVLWVTVWLLKDGKMWGSIGCMCGGSRMGLLLSYVSISTLCSLWFLRMEMRVGFGGVLLGLGFKDPCLILCFPYESCHDMICYLLAKNVSNTYFNIYFSTHSPWLVKIHMDPIKLYGSHVNLINQKECVKKCMLKSVFLVFLISWYNNNLEF